MIPPVSAALVMGLAMAAASPALRAQNEALLQHLQEVHGVSDERVRKLRAVFERSGFIGQGNPAITEHPLTPEACRERVARAGASYADAEFERICGARYMAPLYDPAKEKPQEAPACIDQFEFPDIPCQWPVVWVRAREAAEICGILGKRLCDAHEWEGACAGRLQPPDYRFDLAKGVGPSAAVSRMRSSHNGAQEGSRSWSYGPAYRKGVCGTGSHKTPGCQGGGWARCGSNTYPAGSFPECRSALGVYDLHGNAAEHMNLPLAPSEMASRGSAVLGQTEMKGSWFVFDAYYAHQDWCRWRAPYWHGGRVLAADSHANYHLGFRCCKTLGERRAPSP